MRDIFFFQNVQKLLQNFEMQQKNEKIVLLCRKFPWTGCNNFSLLRIEYLSLAVNVLTNSLKSSDITKRSIFQLSFSHSDKKNW